MAPCQVVVAYAAPSMSYPTNCTQRLTNLESWVSAPGYLQLWTGGRMELWAELISKKRHPKSY